MGSTGKQKTPRRLSQVASRAIPSQSGVNSPAEPGKKGASQQENPISSQALNPQPDASCSCSETEARQEDGSDIDLESCEMLIDGAKEDEIMQHADAMTVEEVVRRRARRVKQLVKLYRRHYWALLEELRFKYREYYMKNGKSGLKEEVEEAEKERDSVRDLGDDGIGSLQLSNRSENDSTRCAFQGCKAKPMALCSFCYNHILSDSRQQLYKPCSYVIKSGQTGPVSCGKPVLKAAVPSLCTVHFQKAQKHVARSLKKAGLNASSSSKPAPKFHLIIAEYVSYVQSKRREARNAVPIDNVDREGVSSLNANKDTSYVFRHACKFWRKFMDTRCKLYSLFYADAIVYWKEMP